MIKTQSIMSFLFTYRYLYFNLDVFIYFKSMLLFHNAVFPVTFLLHAFVFLNDTVTISKLNSNYQISKSKIKVIQKHTVNKL